MNKARLLLLTVAGLVILAAIVGAQVAPLLNPEYETRARAVKPDDAKGHFELGIWAFKQGLFQEAGVEADKLLALDKDDTRGKYLKNAAEFYRTGKFGVVEVGPKPPIGPEQGRRATIYNLTDEEVAQVYAQYTERRMIEFRDLMRNWIIPRCASADCHGDPDRSPLYLKTEKPFEKRTLAENLRAVEPFLNKLDLPSSRIMSVTLEPAGTHPGGPVFRNENEPGYRALKNWVTNLPGMWGP